MSALKPAATMLFGSVVVSVSASCTPTKPSKSLIKRPSCFNSSASFLTGPAEVHSALSNTASAASGERPEARSFLYSLKTSAVTSSPGCLASGRGPFPVGCAALARTTLAETRGACCLYRVTTNLGRRQMVWLMLEREKRTPATKSQQLSNGIQLRVMFSCFVYPHRQLLCSFRKGGHDCDGTLSDNLVGDGGHGHQLVYDLIQDVHDDVSRTW